MNQTPLYALQYFVPNMVIGSNLDLDKNRFTTIENQLYNIYNIFGNGVSIQYDASGVALPSWDITPISGQASVQISSGRGHIGYVYAETDSPTQLDFIIPATAGNNPFSYFVYAAQTSTTPIDKSVNFVASSTQISDPVNYIALGVVTITIDANGNYLFNIDITQKQTISLTGTLTTLIKNHVHIGGANNPSPIDLSKHVTGFLSSDHIAELDLSKVTSGTLDPNRLPQIDHNSLKNIGTLTHTQIDSLISDIQNAYNSGTSSQFPNANYEISDFGIVNRLQIILALKKQIIYDSSGNQLYNYFNIDGEQLNSIFYTPYVNLNNFVDQNMTTPGIVNTDIHRIIGKAGTARLSNIIKINTAQDFNNDLLYAQDAINNPATYNVVVTGVNSTTQAGTINFPYGLTGSATSLYISSYQDGFISIFDFKGNYITRKNNFDQVYNLNTNSPMGLWYDQSQDNLFIADTFNHRVIITDGNLNKKFIVPSNASGIPGGVNNVIGFNFPKGVYGFGNTFYVADSGNNQIQKWQFVNGSPQYTTTYSVALNSMLNVYDELNDPRGIISTTINSIKFLFVADYNNHRILCGTESNNQLSIYQILGNNSAGLGLFNTTLISAQPYASVLGLGVGFTYYGSVNGTISTIGIANSGMNYKSGDLFEIYYSGQPTNGFIQVNTNASGNVINARPIYGNGFSTSDVRGFNHPQGLAFSSIGNRLDLIISDTDNNRIINYHGFTGVGFGATNNNLVYTYNFGTSGSLSDTNNLIYFSRPTGLYSLGFTTLFVADNLNNKVHSLSTSTFANNSIGGFNTLTFGAKDSTITSGGVVLDKPLSYISISSSFVNNVYNSNWYYGDVISPDVTIQANNVSRYNFCILSTPYIIQNQDTIGVAFQTLNENIGSLGQVDCYFIYSAGSNITFDKTNLNTNSIAISSLVNIRSLTSTNSSISKFLNISAFNLGNTPKIVGFGFKWSTQTGWTNNESYNLKWTLPLFDPSLIVAGSSLALYRQTYAKQNDSIFIFNQNKYSSSGVYVYRFDTGVNGQSIFNYVSFVYALNGETINFQFRYGNTSNDLNNATIYNFSAISGDLVNLSNFTLPSGTQPQGRYLDIIFNYASDQINTPVVSSITLYYAVYGLPTGFIYDTNVNSAPPETYARFKWSQGKYANISIIPVPNDTNSSYEITLTNSSTVGLFEYLTVNNLDTSDFSKSPSIENQTITLANLPKSPFQIFAQMGNGLLNPQHYISNGSSGFYIADTDNDRIIQIDSQGALVNILQGNIKLTRTNRDFVLLGAYYNSNLKQLYVLFSQYIAVPSPTATFAYQQNLFFLINGITYAFTNPTYFSQDLTKQGLFKLVNSKTATYYITVTSEMDGILNQYSNSAYLQIINPSAVFLLDTTGTGRSDNYAPEDYSVTINNTSFSEFMFNSQVGLGTIVAKNNNVVQNSVDPIYFNNTSGQISNNLLAAYNIQTGKSNAFTVPIFNLPIYFDNIFKPIHVDYTQSDVIILSCVGNYSIRAYDVEYNLIYKVPYTQFTFNEKLGGSTIALDTNSQVPQNLLIGQVGSASTLIGSVSIYNVTNQVISNSFVFNGFDVVKTLPYNNNYITILYDRLGNGIRSKLISLGQDGSINYTLTNFLNKPVSLSIKENGLFYVTDVQGQVGQLFFRTFPLDS
jgi:hypothetical protein